MWNEVLSGVFSSRGKAGFLNIIVDSSLAGGVVLEVQLLQEIDGASLSVRSSDATSELSCPSLDGFQPTDGCVGC